MPKVITQIYEIQDPDEAERMIELGVDRIGSIVLSQSDWKVKRIKEVARLCKKAGVLHSIIPLFGDKKTLFRVMDYYEPDILHLCDNLGCWKAEGISLAPLLERQAAMKTAFPNVKLMRSIPVSSASGLEKIPTLQIGKLFESTSDYLLTDTWLGREPPGGFIGITGHTCDWNTARILVESSLKPVILAGGLSVENVYEAIMAVKPFGVDSCTKTNVRGKNGHVIRFMKDVGKVRSFIDQVRRAERDLAK